MEKRDLRKCELEMKVYANREKDSTKEVCYFHKWFDGINDSINEPEQYAIVENEDGVVRKISLEHYNIRFIGEYENMKKAIEMMLGKEYENDK